MRVLALDFDGVICDSAREAFLVALRTYASFYPDSALLTAVRSRLGSLEGDPHSDPAYAAFLDLLPLGNRAEDFGVALLAIEGGARISDQEQYDEFYDHQDEGWRRRFHHRFYEQRAALRDDHRRAWLALHSVYEPLPDILSRLASTYHLAIATAKDEASVRVLLEDFGIAPLFGPGTVLDKETGVQKTDHLRHLRATLGVDFAAITFLEDKVKHLERAAALGVRPVLAGWGYGTPREKEVARRAGIPVAGLDDLEQVLASGRAS